MAVAAIVGDGHTGCSHPPTINHSKGADKTGNPYAHNCVAVSIETFKGKESSVDLQRAQLPSSRVSAWPRGLTGCYNRPEFWASELIDPLVWKDARQV